MCLSRHPFGFRKCHRPLVLILAFGFLAVGSACSTGSGTSSDEWSRDYVTTHDRAYEAAIDALGDIDFYLESEEPDRGRIRARSSARRGGLEVTLLVDIRESGDRTRVDVMAQSPGLEEGRAPVQVSGIVRDWGLDLFSGHLFVFFSRRGNTVKILTWDRGGFVVWHKRLEYGRYKIPKTAVGDTRIQMDAGQLSMLLDGVDLSKVRRQKRWEPKKRN